LFSGQTSKQYSSMGRHLVYVEDPRRTDMTVDESVR